MRVLYAAVSSFVVAPLASASASASAFAKPPPVLALPFELTSHGPESPLIRHRSKRAGTADTLVQNVGGPSLFFSVNATLGTPPQPVTLQLDTGSADLVALTKESSYCSQLNGACGEAGFYNPNKSSTYKYVSSNWTGDYGVSAVSDSQSGGTGDFAYDSFGFGGATIKNLFMAIAYKGDLALGILGLAYPGLEVTVEESVPPKNEYDNFPQALVKQGIINIPAFSLWCDYNKFTGTILFGGIDKKKYNGTLTAVDIQKLHNLPYYSSLAITLNNVVLNGLDSSSASTATSSSSSSISASTSTLSPSSLTLHSSSLLASSISTATSSSASSAASSTTLRHRDVDLTRDTTPLNVTVDTGSQGIRITDEMFNPLLKALNGTFNSTISAIAVDCELMKNTEATVDFVFPGVNMTIPLGSLVGYYGNGLCLIEISGGAQDGVGLIGALFLKNVYTVFDLETNQISFATRDWANSGESDVVALGSPGSSTNSSDSGSGSGSGSGTGTSSSASSTPTKEGTASGLRNTLPSLLQLGALLGISSLVVGVVFA